MLAEELEVVAIVWRHENTLVRLLDTIPVHTEGATTVLVVEGFDR